MSTAELRESVKATIHKAFPFSVDKFPLSGPDGMKTDLYGLFTSKGEHVGSAVKQSYVPHTVDDVATLAEAACIGFHSGMNASIQCRWTGKGHKVVISPSREYRRSIYGTKDNIFPRAIIDGGYGYTSSFRASLGMFRDACSNLQMIRSVEGTTVSFRHTASLRDNLDELVANFEALSGSFDNVVEVARHLEEQTHSVEDFIANLYPLANDASQRQINKATNRARSIVNRIIRERRETGRPGNAYDVRTATLWELVNGVTGYVQHDKSPSRSKLSNLDAGLAAIKDKESEAAWNYTMALAS